MKTVDELELETLEVETMLVEPEEKTDEELELETLEVETMLVEAPAELNSEQVASRQRAHNIKVAKFLAGGEF